VGRVPARGRGRGEYGRTKGTQQKIVGWRGEKTPARALPSWISIGGVGQIKSQGGTCKQSRAELRETTTPTGQRDRARSAEQKKGEAMGQWYGGGRKNCVPKEGISGDQIGIGGRPRPEIPEQLAPGILMRRKRIIGYPFEMAKVNVAPNVQERRSTNDGRRGG